MLHEDWVVIVTGAGGRGCGRSISTRFAKDGAAIVVSDIDEVSGHETVREIERNGGRSRRMKCAVTGNLSRQQSELRAAYPRSY